jgi:hypothetical protein
VGPIREQAQHLRIVLELVSGVVVWQWRWSALSGRHTRPRLRNVHPATEQKVLAAAKQGSFRIIGLMEAAEKGLMEAADKRAVSTKMGTLP